MLLYDGGKCLENWVSPCSVLRKVAAEIPSFIFITPAMEQSHSKRLSSLNILLAPHHKLHMIFTQYAFV